MSASDEYILTPNPKRFVLFPIKHTDVWAVYKKMISSFWTVEEADMTQDVIDFKSKLTDNERHFLSRILSFFAVSDGLVSENLASRFSTEVQIPELRAVYQVQIFQETIHAEAYSLMIDTYIADPEEKMRLLDGISNIPVVAKKANWALKWIESRDAPFNMRLVAFSLIEGLFFSGSFCAIYWFRERSLMPGLCVFNQWISADEGVHCEFACMVYSMMSHKLSDEVVHAMVREAVDIEREFIVDAIPCAMIGMNSEMMTEYIEFIADRCLAMLGHPKIYGTRNPFDFMEKISVEGKANFFEKRVTDYSKSGVGTSVEDRTFKIDDDF